MNNTGFSKKKTKQILNVAIDPSEYYPLCEKHFESTQAASYSVVGISATSLEGILRHLRNRIQGFCGEVYKESEDDKETLNEITMICIHFQHLFSGLIGTLEPDSTETAKMNAVNLVLIRLYKSSLRNIQTSFEEIQKLFNNSFEFLSKQYTQIESTGTVDMNKLKTTIVSNLYSVIDLLDNAIIELISIQKMAKSFWENAHKEIHKDKYCKTIK